MKAACIIVAGGCGKRFGSKTPKQFLPLCGKPVFIRSAEAFASIRRFKQIIIVVPEQFIKYARKTVNFQFSNYASRFTVVNGGKERFDSVKNGLSHVEKDADFIAVHDAARPLITKKDVLAVLKKAFETKAAIAAEKTKDTVKTVKNGFVIKTLDRRFLYNVQTPQIFEASLLRKAYSKKIPSQTTDDSTLIENAGVKAAVVETTSPNFKITSKSDFLLAELMLKKSS
jgi:2-C-methyl-D-erythritol 4-phosphate cytidylyltransferase